MRLVIIGAGFAGMYAAISAARLRHLHGVSSNDFEICLELSDFSVPINAAAA